MPTWRALWRQRLRWQRGALENIGAYGLTRATALYWGQQLTLAYGVIALNVVPAPQPDHPARRRRVRALPVLDVVGVIFVVERLVTVWAAGWRARALAAPIFLELGYALFLQACFVASLGQVFTGKKAGWNYVRPRGPGTGRRSSTGSCSRPASCRPTGTPRWPSSWRSTRCSSEPSRSPSCCPRGGATGDPAWGR